MLKGKSQNGEVLRDNCWDIYFASFECAKEKKKKKTNHIGQIK